MKPRIDMIGIITSKLPEMKAFYKDVLGFDIVLEMDEFVEFKNDGVRFALSTNAVMAKVTEHESFREEKRGHSFELAFRVGTPAEVDTMYAELIKKGATPIKGPEDQPWNQRTAFFADPDGNSHEVFADVNA